MRAASLFAVFALLRIAMMWGRPVPLSIWTPFAFFWQDAALALGFLAFERFARRKAIVSVAYYALVLLAVVNAPVVRVLSTPLTVPMMRAARGTLMDSLLYHATPGNLALAALLLGLGIVLPRLLPERMPQARALVAGALAFTLVGPFAANRIDTWGRERNPLFALARTALPRVRPGAAESDFRASDWPAKPAPNLARFRAAAAGTNVLLVVLESTAAQYLEPYGAAEDPTPNLSELARRSIVIESAYAVYPESVKGFLSVIASRFPAFDRPAEHHVPLASPSLATRLAAEGYATGLFHSGRFMYLGMDALLAGTGFGTLHDAGHIGGNHNSSFGIDETAAVQHILAWIDALPREQRFFVAYLPIAGHHPYAYSVDAPFSPEQEIDRYRNALFEGDVAVGTLLDGLRSRGLADSTLVVVLGDHGEAFGQHPGNYGHTLALYDENVRVPLLFAVPGVEGVRVDRTASLVDTAPTVLDLLGLDAPAPFQGASLLDGEERVALFYTDQSLGLLGLRDGCIKLIHELDSRRSRAFDVCHDPEERVDIADRMAQRAEAYAQRLRAWSAAQVREVNEAAPEMDRNGAGS
jgi:hypothetical protein